MAMLGVGSLCRLNIRQLSYTAAVSAISKPPGQIGEWRIKRGMGPCGNEYGPLAEIPDWSYADGRPAPLRPRQIERRQKQIEMCERIVQLTKEVKFARENHARKEEAKRQEKERFLSRKLRPKIQM